MSAELLDGDAFLAATKDDLAARVRMLEARGVTPGLGTILVGDDPNSASYVRRKHQNCADVGIASVHLELPSTATTQEVFAAVDQFNDDPAVDAFIVQLPLPSAVDEAEVLLRIDPAKDADGLHPVNLGKLVMGVEAPVPCTPAGIQSLLAHHGVPIKGKHVVILGRGLSIGRPLA